MWLLSVWLVSSTNIKEKPVQQLQKCNRKKWPPNIKLWTCAVRVVLVWNDWNKFSQSNANVVWSTPSHLLRQNMAGATRNNPPTDCKSQSALMLQISVSQISEGSQIWFSYYYYYSNSYYYQRFQFSTHSSDPKLYSTLCQDVRMQDDFKHTWMLGVAAGAIDMKPPSKGLNESLNQLNYKCIHKDCTEPWKWIASSCAQKRWRSCTH